MMISRRALLMAGVAVVAACTEGRDLPPLPVTPDLSGYRLGPGDVVQIKVLGGDEITGQYIVQDDGSINMLLIGKVPAAGMTTDQLAANIERGLAAGRFMKTPHASVAVLSYRPFFILGEVAAPGGYPYVPAMRVLSAVAAAKGFTYRANQAFVIINRGGQDNRADPMTAILPDDIIKVPERYF